jgi:threonine synthase
MQSISYLTHLECSKTGKAYDAGALHNVSDASVPLLARYNLKKVTGALKKSHLSNRPPNMWRYHELLPILNNKHRITMGEGFTPLRQADSLGKTIGGQELLIKDESLNPTGSFKARGISAAISAALERGATMFAIPSAGNAAGALAAYAAAAGCEAHVFMPDDTPRAFVLECEYYGAHVELIDGLISDCGKIVQERKEQEGWFDVSTLKEPYRLEGKKTMGLELAEQMNWKLPDVIIYPTGGGTGLLGMWKAFKELQEMGWIDGPLPRMVVVQTAGCAPIVRAFDNHQPKAEHWENARTVASGLRVPDAIGDFMILDVLNQSEGNAVSVTDEELVRYSKVMAEHTGIFPAPEGGATLAALVKLKERQWVQPEEKVVLFNTGSGFKYMDALDSPAKLQQKQTEPI